MRWIAGVFALVITTLLLHAVTATAPVEARATLGLGLLLLAAVLGGALAARCGLSRITGYIVAGIAMGPAWRGYVRGDEVLALRLVLDAGFALIAVALGMELRLDVLRRHARAIGRLCAGAISGPVVGVAAFVLALGSWFPITAHEPLGDRISVALVLGCLAAASSPLILKALVDETEDRGLFSRLLLVVVAVKDVAVVLLLAFALAAASVIASRGAVDHTILWRPALLFTGSIALGVTGGWLAAVYLRMVRGHTPLVLVALGFLAAYVVRQLQLDVVVAGLAAGCVVINYARPEGERLTRVLQRGAPALYGVVFVIVGAGLQLGAFAEVWPWVLAVALVRAFGLHYGLRWAGQDVGVSPTLARYGWLGMVSQAGVTLGLAAVVRRAFPEWGVSLEAFVLGMIGVHETIGPVLFWRGLRRPVDGEARNAESLDLDGVAVLPGHSMQ